MINQNLIHVAECEELSQVGFGFECVPRMNMEGCTHTEEVCPQSDTKEVYCHSYLLCVSRRNDPLMLAKSKNCCKRKT